MRQEKLNKENNKTKKLDYTYWNYTEGIIFEMRKPVKEWPNEIINVIPIAEKHYYNWI